jgi:hypothetical protein
LDPETNIYGVSCIQDIMVVPVLEPDTELLSVTFPPGEISFFSRFQRVVNG